MMLAWTRKNTALRLFRFVAAVLEAGICNGNVRFRCRGAPCTLGLYLEKLGEDTLEEALTEMDRALARMPAG